jgi:hypothetical protein
MLDFGIAKILNAVIDQTRTQERGLTNPIGRGDRLLHGFGLQQNHRFSEASPAL